MEDTTDHLREYHNRAELLRSHGYDIDAERDFLLRQAQPLRGRLLEVGTGKGYFTVTLAGQGYPLTTVDISAEEQAAARAVIASKGLSHLVTFVVADAVALPMQTGEFGMVLSANMIHHLTEPLAVIREMLRVTDPKGKLLISDFSLEGFELIGRVHQAEGRIHSHGVISLSELADNLTGQGLTVERRATRLQEILIIHK